MDILSKTHRALSPETAPTIFRTSSLHSPESSEPSFPIIAIAIIGILATAFLLVSYYVFVIKCCLSWHQVDILRRFSLSRSAREHDGDPLTGAEGAGAGGLDESTIRSIPIFLFKNDDVNLSECAVCLSEFEESEKLRRIPNCRHAFHIDCIDVWLQSSANCPLCRTSVSTPPAILPGGGYLDQVVAPSSSPADPAGEEDYVVIELDSSGEARPETGAATGSGGSRVGSSAKRARKFQKGTSMGDECIEMAREKDERFSVEPIRRSFSMDSSADRKMFAAIQEALRQHNVEGNRSVRRSFFSFGHGSRGSSRSAVLPVYLEP